MKRFSILLISSTLIGLTGFAQTNNELMRMGDAAMANGQYSNAVHYYSYVLHKRAEGDDGLYYPFEVSATEVKVEENEDGTIKPPEKPSTKEMKLINKLADAYRLADDYQNAEIWYTAALENPMEEFPYARYFYGVSLMYNEKFEDAIVQFEQFQTENPQEDNKYYRLSTDKMASCHFALNPINTKEDIQFRELDSLINAGSTSFGLQFTSTNHVLFSSARVHKDGSSTDSTAAPEEKPDAHHLELYMLDIYIVEMDEEGNPGTPEKFPFEINSKDYHEGSAVISQDGNTIFFTKMDPANRNETKVYCSRKFNNTWLAPFALDQNVNMDGFRSMNPYLAADGKTMYYSSNRPGGEGGMDIWVIELGPNGETSNPQNIGNNVNTPEDEITPFYHDNTRTLYFSSGGHIGFGGIDVFTSKLSKETDWFLQAVNAGAPINSSRDDSYFVIDESLQKGYVTSDRASCTECDSIYNLSIHCNKIYEIKKPELKFKISGHVYDIATNEIIPGAKVDFKDVTYKWEHFDIVTDGEAYYEHELIPNLELFMKGTAHGYFADQALVITLGETESKDYVQDFYLEKIPDAEIEIEGIEYDFDKATLRPRSKLELDTLITFLELNSDIKIEIRSHTDERGNDDYNYDLSDRRAKSVVDYLVDNGIPRERLVPQGYGETLPADVEYPADSGQIVKLTPEYIYSQPRSEQKPLHQRNRRTAFFVLEQN